MEESILNILIKCILQVVHAESVLKPFSIKLLTMKFFCQNLTPTHISCGRIYWGRYFLWDSSPLGRKKRPGKASKKTDTSNYIAFWLNVSKIFSATPSFRFVFIFCFLFVPFFFFFYLFLSPCQMASPSSPSSSSSLLARPVCSLHHKRKILCPAYQNKRSLASSARVSKQTEE